MIDAPSSPNGRPVREPRRVDRDRGWLILAINALPGALAGAHLANLLFFLNPGLPFEPLPLARVVLLYGSVLGLFSCALLTPFTWGRGMRAQRLLPWTITLVLTVIAILDWVHAARYPFYLPPGINARLIKAAIWMTLTSLICFYTALLHGLHRRPYGRRSRYGLTLLALASVYVMAERREAFKPRPGPAPLPSAVEASQRPALYVVGLGGGSLDAVLPLARQGRLPFFAKLLEEGVYARPRSLAPVKAEALWTTLATGRYPYQHGIVSGQLYPARLVARNAHIGLLPTPVEAHLWEALDRPLPVDARFRQALAIWDVLERLQFESGVVGWPVSDPVSGSDSFRFSHRYFQGEYREFTAEPRQLAERGLLFRVEPEEVDPALLEGLDNPAPYSFLRAISGDLWRESLTLFLLDQRRQSRALFLMLPGLAEVSRRNFGGFAAVQFAGVQREPNLAAARLVTTYYRHLDRFLAALWERATGPRILVVVSAYGFEAPEGWHKLLAQLTGRAIRGRSQQAPDGLFIMSGDGVRSGEFLDNVRLIDVMPTLLYALGFPIARDLDGQVLTGAFSGSFLARTPLTVMLSYETLVPQYGPFSFPLVLH